MRNIHDHNEYHKYVSTTEDNENSKTSTRSSGSGISISTPCWIVIGIVVLFLISFISDGASFEAIEGLLAFGLIAYCLPHRTEILWPGLRNSPQEALSSVLHRRKP